MEDHPLGATPFAAAALALCARALRAAAARP
jgi:hypothetical protein